MSMGRPPKQNETRNVVKAQLKTDARTYNSHIEDQFYHDGDAKGDDDKNVEFDEYE